MLRTRPLEPIPNFPRGRATAGRRASAPRYRLRNEAVFWRRRVAVLLVLTAIVLGPLVVVPRILGLFDGSVALEPVGLSRAARDNHVVNKEQLAALTFRADVRPASKLRTARVTVDGRRVDAEVAGGVLVWKAAGLADGRHRVSVAVDRPGFLPAASRSFSFDVDTKAPRLDVKASATKVRFDEPVTFTGTVEKDVRLTVDGKAVEVKDGAFSRRIDAAAAGRAQFVATDEAGNSTVVEIPVAIDVPPTRSVHMTALAWATPSLREPVLRLVDQGVLNAVQLDLKEEDGYIGYKSAHPLANEIGAVKGVYDLKKAVDDLHARNVRVIGRLVAFRDGVYANAMWKAGKRDHVIQTADGKMYTGHNYGGFTNFAHPEVQRYNADIAEEASRLGVDDILYDYVRRPDGSLTTMHFPGLTGTPEDAIVTFLADTRARIRPHKALLGASVFGIAATRPTQIAQDIPKMAQHVDYIAPMVYPSHWNKGEYGVANPNAQPYDIVQRSLRDFQKKVQGTNAEIIPWLQDFSLGVTYGPAQISAQIKGAADIGIEDWIMWDAAVTYTAAGLPKP